MTRLSLIMFFVLLTVFSCKNISQDYKWRLEKDTIAKNPFNIKYQPLINQLLLTAGTRQNITLISPYITHTDTIPPSSIYKGLTILDDRDRQTSFTNSWFVLKLKNLSKYSQWACVTDNTNISERLFMKKSEGNDSLLELKGIKNYDQRYIEPVGNLFKLDIKRFHDITILFKFSTTEPTFIKTITFYAYSESVIEPQSNISIYSFIAGLSVFIIILFLYFLFVSRDFVYLMFILYFLIFVWQFLIAFDFISVFKLSFSTLQLIIALRCFSIYALLVLLFIRKFKWTKSSTLLVLLIFLQLILNEATSLFIVRVGINWILLCDLIITVSYLSYVYSLQKFDKSNLFNWSLILTIFVFEYFNKIREYYFIDFPSIFFHFIYLGIGTLLSFLVLFIVKFIKFRKAKRQLEIAKVITLQKEISGTVIKTQEEERKRISQDIHDELGSNLALLKIKLFNVNIEKEQLQNILGLINSTSASARSIAYKLMPPYFSDTDFKTLLLAHFNGLNEKGAMKFDFHFTGQPKITKEEELMIYRIILEMAQNCLKHSQAKNVLVELVSVEKLIKINCTDDGKGFSFEASNGIGMQSIHSRVAYLGGTITINSSSSGTKIEISIPYKN